MEKWELVLEKGFPPEVRGDDCVPVAVCTGLKGEDRARLIAAAPDLLAALEGMIRSHAPTINGLCKICRHYGDDCEANAARAAIAKARGEA